MSAFGGTRVAGTSESIEGVDAIMRRGGERVPTRLPGRTLSR